MGNKNSRNVRTERERREENDVRKLEAELKKKQGLEALRTLLSVERFDPDKEIVTHFIQRFDDMAAICKVEDAKVKKCVFGELLPDNLHGHFSFLHPSSLKTDDNWDGFCKAMIDSIHPLRERYRHEDMLRQVTQGDRSVAQFRQEIRRLADMAYVHSNETEEREIATKECSVSVEIRGMRPELIEKILENRSEHSYHLFNYAEQYRTARYEKREEPDEALLIAALTVENTCYFATERKQSVERLPREAHSAVTTNCGGEHTRMADLEKNRANLFGTINELEVVLARGAGLFVDATPRYAQTHFRGKFICEEHLNELSRKWKSKKWQRHIRTLHDGVSKNRPEICGITTHDRQITRKDVCLSKEQAMKYLHHCNRLLHVGHPICPIHAAELDNLPPIAIENDQTTPDESMDTEFDSNNPEIVDANRIELQAAFAAFADKAKVSGVAPAPDFGNFTRDTKMRRVSAMKKLVKIIASLIAPNDEDELMRLYIESLIPNSWMDCTETKLTKVFEEVANQYEKTEDRRQKEIILSSIVNIIGLTELHNYIPGLSSRKYHSAKIRARSSVPIKEPVIRLTRYEPIRVNYFVTFLTSPLVCIGIPYGERKAKLADGFSISILNTIRLHRNVEIIRMFKKHMKYIGKEKLMLGDSTMHAILKQCSATRRHALTCVDYFMADGADAFEDIDDILDTLQGSALLDVDMAKLWKYNVAQSRLYLKTDFRMHLKMESQVIDHCYIHSLSESSNPHFKHSGGNDHDHTVRCPRCVMMDATFKEITSCLENLKNINDKKHASMMTEMIIRMKNNVEKILSMKKHLVRAGYTDLERTRLIDNLKDGEAFVTMDFAQKFLAMHKWESQRKYFGKRGMSWHVFHAIAKINGEYAQHSFVHVLHTSKQDNHSVVQMLDHVLGKLHEVKITGIHLRADNADDAYHSLGTIASIPHLVEKNGVKVLSFSFSEAQNGKSSCDRVAAQVKRKLRDYVDRGKNIKNERDLFNAIADSGLRGLSVYLATVKREKTEKAEKDLSKTLYPNMTGISDYGHFEFNGKNVRVRKMHGIGEGRLYKDLSGFTRKMKIDDEGGFLTFSDEAMKKGENTFWSDYLTKKDKTNEEPDHVDEIDPQGQEIPGAQSSGLFTCPECSASFLKYGNYLRHMDIGTHRVRPEKVHLFDCALLLFKEKLEGIQDHNSILDEVSEAVMELTNGEDHSSREGWALKGKRTRTTYSTSAKKFAEQLFKEGDKSGRKIDPAEVERLMKENDKINPCDRMNAQQIRSYFSALSRAKKASTTQPRRGKDADMEDDENDWDDLPDGEDEENIDDFGRERDDVIHDIILDHLEEIFENPKNPFIDSDN